jgi:hypothetical protein
VYPVPVCPHATRRSSSPCDAARIHRAAPWSYRAMALSDAYTARNGACPGPGVWAGGNAQGVRRCATPSLPAQGCGRCPSSGSADAMSGAIGRARSNPMTRSARNAQTAAPRPIPAAPVRQPERRPHHQAPPRPGVRNRPADGRAERNSPTTARRDREYVLTMRLSHTHHSATGPASQTRRSDPQRMRRQAALAADWLRELRDSPARFARPRPSGPDLRTGARRSHRTNPAVAQPR